MELKNAAQVTDCEGLTKRELFAAMAMQSLADLTIDMNYAKLFSDLSKERGISPHLYIAQMSVNFADALIVALKPKADDTLAEGE